MTLIYLILASFFVLMASIVSGQDKPQPVPTKDAIHLDIVERGRKSCEEQAAFWFVEAQKSKRDAEALRARLPKEESKDEKK